MSERSERINGQNSGRFWLRPKWVVGHVVAVALVVLFVNLGFWQLRRLDERRDHNATIELRTSAPARSIEEVVDPGAAFDEVDELVYLRATATGTYDAEGEILVRSRSLGGQPGMHVLTPLVIDDGPALVVNRGFVPLRGDGAPIPPGGQVDVAGLLFATQERAGIGPRDPAEGILSELARADLARLQQQYGRDLYPVYLQLEEQDPAQGELPVVLPEPDQSEGPHLSYAGQWFLFATIGAVGWPLLVARTAREHTPS